MGPGWAKARIIFSPEIEWAGLFGPSFNTRIVNQAKFGLVLIQSPTRSDPRQTSFNQNFFYDWLLDVFLSNGLD